MSGVDTTGFVTKTLQELKTDEETDLKGSFGDAIDVRPESNFGQIIGVTAEFFSDLWDTAQDVYTSGDPNSATGAALDNLSSLTGTTRIAAYASSGTAYLTGTNGTSVASGKVASTAGAGIRFVTQATVTLSTASAWASTTGYSVGAVRRNGGTQRIYYCTVGGTSAGSGGPTTTASDIVDGTVHWMFIGPGAAYNLVAILSESTGPQVGASGTLTVIETPVSGWQGVNNPLDVSLGANTESDAALRLRRATELRGAGKGTVGAIQTNLLRTTGVTAVTVFENVLDTTSADGLPPHSVECLVTGGTDAAVGAAILANVAAGIQTYGTTSVTVADSQSIGHVISFSRVVEVDIYVAVTVTYDPGLWPTDGSTQTKEDIVEFGDLQRTGKDVVASALAAQVFKVPGALDVTIYIDTSPSPVSSTTIPISPRQLAVFDTSRITVTATGGVP